MQGQTNMLSISLTHFPDVSNLHFINNLRTGNSLFILKESIMNYQHLYDMLCEKAYNRFSDFYVRSSNLRIIKSIIYKETDYKYLEAHHKLPKSDGGLDDLSNIVFFTPKEHIVAHHLLFKAQPTPKHAQAWHLQSHSSKSGLQIKLTAKEFEETRKINAENARKQIYETNRKMCESGRRFGKGNSMYGRIWYTNGIKSIVLKPSDVVPDGFYKGRLNAVPKDRHKSTTGMLWYNDGTINKMFKETDNIPSNFQKGKLKCKK